MTCPICGAEHEVTEGPSGLKVAACPKMTEADGWYLISQSNVVEREGTLVAGEAIATRARNLPGPTLSGRIVAVNDDGTVDVLHGGGGDVP